MRTTIDKAGRVVLPKVLRDQLGITAGEVEVTASGAGIRIEPLTQGRLVEVDGLLVLADGGFSTTADEVREMRLADQR
jgi:AbrB family looped-hinge helix DNA binding protein